MPVYIMLWLVEGRLVSSASPTLVLRVLRANLRRRRDVPMALDRPVVASHVG
ncbi:MAG: hypothetical protein ACREX8_21580 [Gammaproteobacteria bacterium]